MLRVKSDLREEAEFEFLRAENENLRRQNEELSDALIELAGLLEE